MAQGFDGGQSWQSMTEQFRRVFGDEFVQNLMKSINMNDMMSAAPFFSQSGQGGDRSGTMPGGPTGSPGQMGMPGMPGGGFPFGAMGGGAPGQSPSGPAPSSGSPRIDMIQTRHELIVIAELPGVQTGDVKISVLPDRLRLSGQIKRPYTPAVDDQLILSELGRGDFSRDIPLPIRVKTERIRANYKQGYLEVRMFKEDTQEAWKGHEIPIRFE
ncbi:MAG: Hsp20/alpha crystallin family protein [Acidibacillus sp.]|uniref:SHSP domain-containing protein n=1 Tax=Sulfoacidibacillus ferrooxidans TaxID=2005001 RepID=A0A9X1V7Q7_9BACL|nr:Hsp20/alpha crystallin family protein [Sulfoacidibacillus ferrooxidans]MCI0182760.1 hypothetical protein [Sulfoacidibacillus ferrooxidans]MCY0892549.1 Hsp20/alpha crystallin family protein [Acidibacillus sp.]